MVAEKPSYNVKTQIIQDFLKKGSGGGTRPAWRSRHGNLSQNQLQSLSSEARVQSNLVALLSRLWVCAGFWTVEVMSAK